MRARADAILVGRRTVLDDDPLLTCRLPGLEARSPVRIVLARELAGLETLALGADAHDSIRCGWSAVRVPTPRRSAPRVREILPMRLVAGELWLPAVMETLVARGITRLLLEGGPATWRAFSRAGLIDEAVLFHARGADGAELSPRAALTALGALYLDRWLRHLRSANHRRRRYAGGAPALAPRRSPRANGSDLTQRGSQAMFTGIVSDIGEVTAREDGRFTIRARYPAQELEVGGSMACDGCCLTMTSVRAEAGGSVFTVDVSNETRGKTTIGEWRARSQDQPRAVAAPRPGAGRASRHRARRRRCPHCRHRRRTERAGASPSRWPSTSRPTSHRKALLASMAYL